MLDEGRLAVVEDRRLGREVVQALEQVETIRRDPVLGRPAVGEVLARVEHVEALRSTGIARVYWYEVRGPVLEAIRDEDIFIKPVAVRRAEGLVQTIVEQF